MSTYYISSDVEVLNGGKEFVPSFHVGATANVEDSEVNLEKHLYTQVFDHVILNTKSSLSDLVAHDLDVKFTDLKAHRIH